MSEALETILEKIREKFVVSFDPLDVDGKTLEVLTIQNMHEHLDSMLSAHAIKNPLKDLPLWAKIWPGSFVLGRLLRKYEPNGKTLLELGGGCAILSLIAAQYGFASILTTDINEDALLFAKANVLHNHLENSISVRALDLKAPMPSHARLPSYDIIAASEILYLDELHRPLVKFLAGHLKPSGLALFCTDHARHKPRFAKLAQKSFQLQEGHIGVKAHNEEGEEERRLYDILIVRPKESGHTSL